MLKSGVFLSLLSVIGAVAATTVTSEPNATPICSIMPPPPDTGYDPTSLVRDAEVVVLARADSQSRIGPQPGGRTYSVVHLTITEVIDSGAIHVLPTLRVPGARSGAGACAVGQWRCPAAEQ